MVTTVPMSRTARLSAILALVLLAACDSLAFDDGATAFIQVIVVRGPLSPVEQPGTPSWEPVQGARVEARPSAGGVTRTADTDGRGTAYLRVPAGTWIVSVTSCPGAMASPLSQTVDVRLPAGANARFECDTGIR